MLFYKCLCFFDVFLISAQMFCFIEHNVTVKSYHMDAFLMSNPQALRSGAPGWESPFLVICSCLKHSSSLLNSAAHRKPRP